MRITIPNLQPGKNIAIQVRALTVDNASEWSRRFIFTTASSTDVPVVPTGFTWVSIGDSFHAEWNAVTTTVNGQDATIVRYEIELSNGSITKTQSVIQNESVIKYDLSFLENKALFTNPAATVTARVRAVDNKDLKSAWTSVISASNPAPNPVTALTPKEVVDGVNLSWTPPTDDDVIGYNIYASTSSSSFTPSSGNKVGFTAGTTFTYSSLTYLLHFFKVRAVDKFNQESTDASTSGTPTSSFIFDTDPPDTPTSFAVTITDDPSGVLLTQRATATWSWDTTDDSLTGFHIRYRKSGTTAWTTVVAPPDPQQPYLITTGLAPNVQYDFEIRAFDNYGNKSPWVGLQTNAVTPDVDPTLINALIISGGGYIQSANFVDGVGFRLDEDQITIYDGVINAAAITIGSMHSSQPALDINGDVIPGEFAWQIDLQGDAVLGNAKVKGNLVVGSSTETQISVAQSWNFSPGSAGWKIDSAGDAEFNSVTAGTFDGNALKADSVDAKSIKTSVLNAKLTLSGSLETYAREEFVSATTLNGSTTVTTTDTFLPSDVGCVITGENLPANTRIATYVNSTTVSVTEDATASGSGQYAILRGRSVRISGEDGIIISDNEDNPIIVLPTNPNETSQFSGSVTTNDLLILDNFRMSGNNNFLSQGSELSLGSAYLPSTPKVYSSWAFNQGVYDTSDNLNYDGLHGFYYDQEKNIYLSTQWYFGQDLVRFGGPGSSLGEGGRGINVSLRSGAMRGPGDYIEGGITRENTGSKNLFALSRTVHTGTVGEWRVQEIDYTKVFSGVTATINTAYVSSSVWTLPGVLGGEPRLAVHDGKLYIARITGNDRLRIQRFSGKTATSSVEIDKGTDLYPGGNIRSITVGNFDYGSQHIAVCVDGQGTSDRKVYIFKDDPTDLVYYDTKTFPIPYQSSAWGTTWVGSSTDDTSGYFTTMTNDDSRFYRHTKLALNGGATVTAKMAWRKANATPALQGIGNVGKSGTFAFTRRSVMTISAKETIPNNDPPNSPDSVTFYIGVDGGTQYRYEPGTGLSSLDISDFRTSDQITGGTTLPIGTPARIIGEVDTAVGSSPYKLEIKADGTLIHQIPFTSRSLTANQTIPNNVFTTVTFPIADSPPKFIDFNSGTFTINRPGYYQINFNAVFDPNGTGRRRARIMKNTTAIASDEIQGNASSVISSVSVSKAIYMVAGDTLQCQVLQNSGGNLDLRATRDMTYADIFWVGA